MTTSIHMSSGQSGLRDTSPCGQHSSHFHHDNQAQIQGRGVSPSAGLCHHLENHLRAAKYWRWPKTSSGVGPSPGPVSGGMGCHSASATTCLQLGQSPWMGMGGTIPWKKCRQSNIAWFVRLRPRPCGPLDTTSTEGKVYWLSHWHDCSKGRLFRRQ